MSYSNTRMTLSIIASVGIVIGFAGCGQNGHDVHDHEGHEHEHESQTTKPAATAEDGYPLTTCLVSGESLDEMGGPVIIQHEGREVRFCCKDCVNTFATNPATYLPMLDKAASGQTMPEVGGHNHHDH